MPELVWIGKEQVVDLATGIPPRALRRAPELSLTGTGPANTIVHGDNLLALAALLPAYREKVKLVFIDPPYNAPGERWPYEDRLYEPPAEGWFGEVGAEDEDPLRHDKWLCMMYPRLELLRDLLSPEGRIFVTMGENEAPRLRLLMNEVFGPGTFLGCAAWHKGPSPGQNAGFLSKTHNYVVVHAKNAAPKPEANLPTTWWTAGEFGDSEEARRELEALFPEREDLFAIPKPTRLVRRIVEAATDPRGGDVVLDCFAGSGTTAQAVLEQNAWDGGDRRFVLVEMAGFANDLTAERVRRVLSGGDRSSSAGFDFYELDEVR
ncbi:site-specific DNA-methyltransferase [Rubrobacter tropicus]|uniref:site-specific DNA-methyltransferase n=1 Tax=Rubrobacter tropicus TaxID=2653851 RepID=UPI00140D8546|nr:site-specific DNA-methyltransferase [Rubrobacter tropicus]